MGTKQTLTAEEFTRIEQRTLTVSLYGVIVAMIANLIYGMYIAADIVILNGVFALLTLIAAGVSLLAAKLVVRPADKDFQFGYSHIEPLVQCFNGFMLLVICFYAFINGIEGIRSGGHKVNSSDVIWFSILGAIFCALMWGYKTAVSRKIDSDLVKTDTVKWIIKFSFHAVALVGFSILVYLPEAQQLLWGKYVDSGLVAFMAVCLVFFPLNILRKNVRAVLHMVSTDQELIDRVHKVMEEIRNEAGVENYSTHIVEIGRMFFIEIHMLVNDRFEQQSVAQQDRLRQRIWFVIDKPVDKVKFTLDITGDRRWANRAMP